MKLRTLLGLGLAAASAAVLLAAWRPGSAPPPLTPEQEMRVREMVAEGWHYLGGRR